MMGSCPVRTATTSPSPTRTAAAFTKDRLGSPNAAARAFPWRTCWPTSGSLRKTSRSTSEHAAALPGSSGCPRPAPMSAGSTAPRPCGSSTASCTTPAPAQAPPLRCTASSPALSGCAWATTASCSPSTTTPCASSACAGLPLSALSNKVPSPSPRKPPPSGRFRALPEPCQKRPFLIAAADGEAAVPGAPYRYPYYYRCATSNSFLPASAFSISSCILFALISSPAASSYITFSTIVRNANTSSSTACSARLAGSHASSRTPRAPTRRASPPAPSPPAPAARTRLRSASSPPIASASPCLALSR